MSMFLPFLPWIRSFVSKNDVKALVLVRGVPGSGKSTFAREMAKYGNHPVYAADDYFTDKDGNYNFPQKPDVKAGVDKLAVGPDMTFMEWINALSANKMREDVVAQKFRDKLGAAHLRCLDRCVESMKKGDKLIFVNNTFTQARGLKPYINAAVEHKYLVFSVIMENRHESDSVHDVPDDVVANMADELMRNIKLTKTIEINKKK